MAKKVQKTNAVRLLDQQKIPYTLKEYDVHEEHLDGVTAAQEIGEPVEKVFKTLVATTAKKQLYVFVIPVAEELDLKAAAKFVGEKKIDLLPVKELLAHTGYIRGGCSPIGMKKLYPTVIDEAATVQSEIFVSAGKRGMQICIQPQLLAQVVQAKFGTITC
ncbi:MAG: Cys-tRNA(Pro) deacylase [Kurthia gibsonii]|uniref:Cys-tRNA(Pro)/Cys-tRNA(Cys) deacylase n=1 Tax=Kurthia gibsonii TaxID=33946 RepID=A0ABU9LIC9_9BACL|nr:MULTISPECIES: Cys-tRNA(Pro) deacylase [Kurthia]AMA62088.1 aminoacyl-tRNA editing domain protein [Kurthia sp. 11kri321]MEB6113051.1 Cys-tRNA(Pro) deacylase [Kurthia gibsonii]WIL38939.1 Cys-tRNA(Pro) deacylase [Kurthia sp. YJT4]HZG11537.1 Cys-tRNA(Pro) deacylase [Kurthia gibsonii]